MPTRYIEVDAAAFKRFLSNMNFDGDIVRNEVVFSKAHSTNLNLRVKVYTSLGVGDETAREVGADAIRVVAVFDDGKKNFAIYKGARVYRTGSQEKVHARVQERIDNAFARCSEWLKEQSDKQSKSQFIGKPGEEMRLELTCKRHMKFDDRHLFRFEDDAGNAFVFWSDRNVLEEGKRYSVKFRVIEHRLYRGEKQTMIGDCMGKALPPKE